jgi:hypothetical protein
MNNIPTIGSEVEVTVRYRNYNYHTSSYQPFNDTVFKGIVIKNSKWIGSEYFCVKTDNKNHPVSIININAIHDLKLLKGNVSNMRKFRVKGDKGHEYMVTLSNGHYACHCIGFQYHNKCKHVTKVKTLVESTTA